MSETQESGLGQSVSVPRQTAREGPPETTGWVGWVIFAGFMMIMVGIFQAIAGLTALFNDDYFVVRDDNLLVSVDYTGWGWTHLILGVVIGLAGLGVMAGMMWARVIGVLLALGSAMVNIAFLAAFPLWAIMMIVIDVLVIYALTVHGRELKSS
ncbi:MAG: DUF7144 family membrane protein [Actinomycetes bacterium]